MRVKNRAIWNVEMDQGWWGPEYTTFLRISASLDGETGYYDLGLAEAIKIVELESTSQIESVADDIAGRFDPPIPVLEGEAGERFWDNVFSIATRWVEEVGAN